MSEVASDIPSADVGRRRWSPWWLLTLVALAISVGFFAHVAQRQPLEIEVSFRHGHGIKPGDGLRYRGIRVGEVRRVGLSANLEHVTLTVGLLPEGARLAREGSRFWIVRPQVDLTGVAGLETLVGANYLSVLPGNGAPLLEFVGLEEPIVEPMDPRGLELVLQASRVGGLHKGALVAFRQVPIGRVLAVDLASDGSAIEARIYIRPQYTHLLRADSKFWRSGGLRLSGGLTNFSLEVDSIQGLLSGGIAVATPPDAGAASAPATNEARYPLYDGPETAWLEWKPSLTPTDDPVRLGLETLPQSVPIRLRWEEARYLVFARERERSGRVWSTADGLLGPAQALIAPPRSREGSAGLAFGSDSDQEPEYFPVLERAAWSRHGVAFVPVPHPEASAIDQRRPAAPEDVYLVSLEGSGQPALIAAARLRPAGPVWEVDETLALEDSFDGALVVARGDGNVLGMLRLDAATHRIVLGPFPPRDRVPKASP